MNPRLSIALCAMASLLALGSSAPAQTANPFNGSWKMDLSSQHYEGSTFSVAVTPSGYTVTLMGKAMPATVCDGKPHNGSGGITYACTLTSTGYHTTNTQGGKPVSAITTTVAGATMTRKVAFPGQPPSSITSTAKRLSGGPGLAGVWKTVSVRESMVDPMTIAIHGDSIDFKETDQPKPLTVKLDGSETTVPGLGGSVSIRLVDPHTLKVVYSSDHKVRRENTFALGLDGKTISETDFTPDPSASTMTVILHRM
ncbi:MAG: hypothetical protein WBD06_10545 [Acidobacteriaceae bacterium]